MKEINKLGIKVGLITAFVLVIGYGAFLGVRLFLSVGSQKAPLLFEGNQENLLVLVEDAVEPFAGEELTGVRSYTQEYLATLPADVSREKILDKGQLDAFVAEVRGELLPDISSERIQILEPTNAETVGRYFKAISSSRPLIVLARRLEFENTSKSPATPK